MVELWRRLLLLIGVTVAVCMAMFADLAPRISIEQVDFASEQKNPGQMGMFSERNGTWLHCRWTNIYRRS